MNESFENMFLAPRPQHYIEFEYQGAKRRVYGGSFFHAPQSDDFLTINLMAEHPLDCDIYFPIKDYDIPSDSNAVKEVLDQILKTDKSIYMGCFGGVGRTGLMMSCLLKYIGHSNPIDEVRQQYSSHAVETSEQKQFVEQFPFLASQIQNQPKPKSIFSFFKR